MALKYKFVDETNCSFGFDRREASFPVDVWEENRSTRAANKSSLSNWVVFLQDCWDFLVDELPSSLGSLFLDGMSVQQVEDHVVTFDVRYSSLRPPGVFWGHDTTGGTLHVYTSYATARFNRTGFNGISYGGLIGMTEDGPEGVDRVIPALRLNARYPHPAGGPISSESQYLAYAKMVASMTGTTNLNPIFDFAAGELLFLGSVGDWRAGLLNEFDYVFLASKNATGLTIAQSITGVAKEGHDYVWLEYRGGKNEDDRWVPSKPVAVNVERIYEKSDFSNLLIGT